MSSSSAAPRSPCPAPCPGVARLLRWVLAESSLLFTVSRLHRRPGGAPVGRRRARRGPAAGARDRALRASTQAADAAAAARRARPRRRAARGLCRPARAAQGPGHADRRRSPRSTVRLRDVRLALVGGGRLADELRSRAAAAGLAERVHLPGEVSADELRLWLQAADIFAGPSRTRLARSRGRGLRHRLRRGRPDRPAGHRRPFRWRA